MAGLKAENSMTGIASETVGGVETETSTQAEST
jgi:hypothetical protein